MSKHVQHKYIIDDDDDDIIYWYEVFGKKREMNEKKKGRLN